MSAQPDSVAVAIMASSILCMVILSGWLKLCIKIYKFDE